MDLHHSVVVSASPDAVKKAMDAHEPCVLLDVRTPGEYAQGTIAGSINLPVDDIATRVTEKIPDRSACIYVFCRSGARSYRAASYMMRMGYTQVVNMEGGLLGWQAKHFPLGQ